MTFEIYYKDKLCERVTTTNGEKVKVESFVDNTGFRNFLMSNPTREDVARFFRRRSFPESRQDKNTLLKLLGLEYYSPIEIVKATNGRCAEDNFSVRFVEEGNYARFPKS